MNLILQLITYMADSQKLLRDFLLVLQINEHSQLSVFFFLILQTGSVVQYNPSKIHIVILNKKMIHKYGSFVTTRTCAYQGVKKCSFFGKFGVLCFLETPVLRFVLLPYYRPLFKYFLNDR